jgi:polyhydroxyalkanoate synthesis regulator phasin
MVVNASEGNSASGHNNKTNGHQQTQVQIQNNSNKFLSDVHQRQEERFEAFSSKWEKQQTKRDSLNTKFLTLVKTYAPNMLSQYETAFAAHDSIHQDLFTTRSDIYTTFATETNTLLVALKSDIDTKVTAGEITVKEARELIKNFLTERKATHKTFVEAYQLALADEKAAQEVRSKEVKAIHHQLKEAIANEDSATITASIQSLYTYMNQHIAFDQFKLATMKAIF